MIGAIYLLGYSAIRSALTPLRMDNQYLTLGDTVILAPYVISILLSLLAVIWIKSGRLWLKETNSARRVRDLGVPKKIATKK